jgi:Na+-transporting methylmalonyl-CoA/oxaloacetate decarboxylase gamma subunit
MTDLDRGLVIVLAGIVGVFANLLILMAVITGIGKVFGKKKKKKPKTDAGPKAAEAEAN